MKLLLKLKGIVGLSMLVCFVNHVESQTNFIYGKQFGTNMGEFAFNSVPDNLGNVFIAGETNGAMVGQSFGKTDGFVSKYDSLGNTLWTKQIGTGEEDKINWIATDQMGNVYVTGYTKGVVDGRNFGKEDILIAKLDASGNMDWQKQVGTDSTDIGNMIYVDFQGAVYVTGLTKGKMDQSSFGEGDGVILKLDTKGNTLWKKQFGTPKYDECKAITGDSASNLYVCGTTAGNLVGTSKGQWDSFVGKFTDKGEPIKIVQFGTDGYDIATQITIDRVNNLYIGGSTSGDFGSKQQGEGDAFLSKLDKNFEIRRTQQFGTDKWDGINGMALNEQISENIVVSGCQNWPSCQSFIRMYKNDGSLLWVNNYLASGKNGGTCGKGVCIDSNGNIYHTGGTGGSLFKSIDKHEGDDVFLIKLGMDQSQKNH